MNIIKNIIVTIVLSIGTTQLLIGAATTSTRSKTRIASTLQEKILVYAVLNNELPTIEHYLKSGVDPCLCDEKIHTLSTLAIAIRRGNSKIAKLLLQYGVHPNELVPHSTLSYLALAACNNIAPLYKDEAPATLEQQLAVLQVMLEHPTVGIHMCDEHNQSPLFYAACNAPEIVDLLLSHKANPSLGKSPIEACIDTGNRKRKDGITNFREYDIIKSLVAAYGDMHTLPSKTRSTLISALKKSTDPKTRCFTARLNQYDELRGTIIKAVPVADVMIIIRDFMGDDHEAMQESDFPELTKQPSMLKRLFG